MYCIADPNRTLTLYGTRDQKHTKEDHSQFGFIVEICNEKTKLEGDPECSSDEEIDEYLHNKQIRFIII